MERLYSWLLSCLWAVVIVAITVAAVSVSGLSQVRAQSGNAGWDPKGCDRFCTGNCASGGMFTTPTCKIVAGACACD